MFTKISGRKTIAVLAVLCICLVPNSDARADDIAFEIQDLTQEFLRYGDFETYLAGLGYPNTPETYDETTIQSIAEQTSHRLKIHFESLTVIKTAIINGYSNLGSKTAKHPECCGIEMNEYSHILGQKVNKDTWCTHTDHEMPDKFLPPDTIVQAIRDQYKEGVKYIYYGDENGNYYNYPALDFCGPFEPRFRPWYLHGATSKSHDVIIMIQKSYSSISIAKTAATAVIKALNNNDRVAVVSFSGDQAHTLQGNSDRSSCYSNQLAKALNLNREELTEYVNNLNTDKSDANFAKALEKAFEIFNNTAPDEYDKSERGKIILFMTNGKMSDTNMTQIYELIQSGNQKMGNQLVLLTYGLGTGVVNIDVLEAMTKETDIPGEFTKIENLNEDPGNDISTVLHKMTSYFTQYKSATTSFVKNILYTDSWLGGLLFGSCVSIHTSNKLRGVLCLDIDVSYASEYFNEVKNNNFAHIFMVDNKWKVLIHPFYTASENDNYFYDALEGVGDKEGLRTDSTRLSVNKAFTSVVKPIRKGTGLGIDVITKVYNLTYHCHFIEGSLMSLCLVIETGHKTTVLPWEDTLPQVLYHSQTDGHCSVNGKPAVQGRSTVMLQRPSFKTSVGMAKADVNSQNGIMNIVKYLEEKLSYNPSIKDDVRATAAATFYLETIWKTTGGSEFILLRYFASSNGVLRTFPGLIKLKSNYDSTTQPWYSGAIAETKINSNNIYITPARISDFMPDIVITISKAIQAGPVGLKYTFGVIAIDLTLESFYYKMVQEYRDCETKECVIINDSGYIVMKKSWLTLNNPEEFSQERHLAFDLPAVAKELIDNNIMQSVSCVHVSSKFEDRLFWKINLERYSFNNLKLSISSIVGTNTYLVVVKQFDEKISCTCRSDGYYSCLLSASCYCPCFSSYFVNYQYCAAVFTTTYALACAPKLSGERAESGESYSTGENCVKHTCAQQKDQRNCKAVEGCDFCYHYDGQSIDQYYCLKQYCSEAAECPGGELLAPPRNVCALASGYGVGDGGGGMKAWQGGLIGSFVTLVVVILVFVIGIIIVIKRRPAALFKSDSDPTYNTVTVDAVDNSYLTNPHLMNQMNTMNKAFVEDDPVYLHAPNKLNTSSQSILNDQFRENTSSTSDRDSNPYFVPVNQTELSNVAAPTSDGTISNPNPCSGVIKTDNVHHMHE